MNKPAFYFCDTGLCAYLSMWLTPDTLRNGAAPDRREVKKYSVIDKASLNRGNGGMICMCEKPIPIDAENYFIPSNLI